MTDHELEEIRRVHAARLNKARTGSLDYAEGVQCLLDCSALLAEIERLRQVQQLGGNDGN